MAKITEWEFTGEVASWLNEFIQDTTYQLPFSRAKIEQRARGSRKRRDLTLLGHDGKPLLTGEVKLPWRKDGQSPFAEAVVVDARKKASQVAAPWFFTWNVRELVLWSSGPRHSVAEGAHYKSYRIAPVAREEDLDTEFVSQSIREGLREFLLDFSRIVEGVDQLPRRPPDDYFIESLESFLESPIELAYWELSNSSSSSDKRRQGLVRHWMVRDQGWTLSGDDNENWRRAAQFSTYAVVNKLVFYEALRKRFPSLSKLTLPQHVSTGEETLERLVAYFSRAQHVSRDYETVFAIDSTDIGTRIPFYPRDSADPWRNLIDHIEKFDFTSLDYEVIGRFFERLIAPNERHRYGQYYTRPEVVDLINSFCIPHGVSSVLDPACGGGTFLVRAYARKRKLAPQLSHPQFVVGLYGVDISHFAAHLTTINLASRDLVEAENYPRVVRSDFFDLSAGGVFMKLPEHDGVGGDSIVLRNVDAVVGNPPYVRQEDIPNGKTKGGGPPRKGTKAHYLRTIEDETGIRLSGRSDLHCYFWGHASTFLTERGWLGLLTSSQWLDVEYGFRLQGWLLENFRIVAILESRMEPWFVGARVATAITIAQREPAAKARDENIVRFVELRRPLEDMLIGDGTSNGMIDAADRLRDRFLQATRPTANDEFRLRLVPQRNLRMDGIKLGRLMGTAARVERDGDKDISRDSPADGAYFGGKWGIHLRAPDIWFDLLGRTQDAWCPLGQMAYIRRGVTTGADSFFYVRDVSREALGTFPDVRAFAQHYGVSRQYVGDGTIRLVRNGKGEVVPIEARFLEPEVHSLMEVHRYTVAAADCARLVLLVGPTRRDLRGTYVLQYIERGENEEIHSRRTCSSRVTKGDLDKDIPPREWYELTKHSRGSLFFMKSSQYKHIIPVNTEELICNCNLYDVFPKDGADKFALGGILNSSIVVLGSKLKSVVQGEHA